MKPLQRISSKEIFTGAARDSAQVDRIFRTPCRDVHMTPRFNVEVFSPSHYSRSRFAKLSRDIDPFNTSIDIYLAQERNSTSFYIDKISVKCLPGEVVTNLDPSKRMNFASSILGESPKFIDFRLLSVNATGKPNSVFAPST